MIEDECMISSRCMVVERRPGARRARCSASGAILTKTTHVIDVSTGEELPPARCPPGRWRRAARGPRKFAGGEFGMPCLLILQRLTEGERHDKTELNAILRDHGADG